SLLRPLGHSFGHSIPIGTAYYFIFVFIGTNLQVVNIPVDEFYLVVITLFYRIANDAVAGDKHGNRNPASIWYVSIFDTYIKYRRCEHPNQRSNNAGQ